MGAKEGGGETTMAPSSLKSTLTVESGEYEESCCSVQLIIMFMMKGKNGVI